MTHKVRIGPLSLNMVVEWTTEKYLAEAKKGLKALKELEADALAAEKAWDKGQGYRVSHWWARHENIDRCIRTNGAIRLFKEISRNYWGDAMLRDIRKLIEETEFGIEILDSGGSPAHYFVTTKGPEGTLWDFIIVRGAGLGCQKCGILLHQNSLKRHLDSPSCRQRAGKHEHLQHGWVKISDQTTLQALKDAGIEHETRPVVFATWAPQWVLEAANQYRKNKGFAGMSLKDYLLRMKDN